MTRDPKRVTEAIAELREKLGAIDEAIAALERLVASDRSEEPSRRAAYRPSARNGSVKLRCRRS